MKAVLIKNDVWQYVNGEVRKPVTPGKQNHLRKYEAEWMQKDNKAKSDIILSIKPSKLKQIEECQTSHEIWLKLEKTCTSKRLAQRTLLKQLRLQRMKDGDDVREHVQEFLNIVDELAEKNIEINPEFLAIMLLYSLPSSFDNFRCDIELYDELPSLEALKKKIMDEVARAKEENTMASARTGRDLGQSGFHSHTYRGHGFLVEIGEVLERLLPGQDTDVIGQR